jgi:glycosyltransferase involved in cell wall biosynthesis
MVSSAIQSVCDQTFKDWELIVVNDGSTDHTASVLEFFSKNDSRIKIHSQKNLGVTATRANGTARAQGDYIAFLDDDDAFTADKLEKQSDFLDNHSEIDLVYSQVESRGEKCPLPKIWPVKPATDFHGLIKQNTIQPNAVLLRRRAIEKFGNFNSDLKSCDDYDLWLRIAHGGKIAYLPGVVGIYNWHQSNVSRNSRQRSKSNFKIYRSLLKRGISAEDKKIIREQVGFKNYMEASDALGDRRYDSARYHFLCALIMDPKIGLAVPWNKNAAPVYRFLRPYLGLTVTLLKSVAQRGSAK